MDPRHGMSGARHRQTILWLLVVSCSVLPVQFALAGDLRVLAAGELPQDARLGPLKDLNGYFPFYNFVSRASMYSWLNEHMQLGLPEPIVEESYQRLGSAELTVWDQEHQKPAGGPRFERDLLRWWDVDANKQLDSLLAADGKPLAEYQKVVGAGIDALIGRGLPAPETLEFQEVKRSQQDGIEQIAGLLTHRVTGPDTIALSSGGLGAKVQEQLPVVALLPGERSGRVCIWISERGKAGLFDEAGRPSNGERATLRGRPADRSCYRLAIEPVTVSALLHRFP